MARVTDLPPPSIPVSSTAIRVVTKTHPIGVLLRAMKPRITIDGEEHKTAWGVFEQHVAPGDHVVTVALPYANARRRPPSVTVTVPEGATVDLSYTGPASKTGSGKLNVI